jgi:hypothetical protein
MERWFRGVSTRGRRLGGRVGERGASRDLRASKRRRRGDRQRGERREEKTERRCREERREEKRLRGSPSGIYMCLCVYIYTPYTRGRDISTVAEQSTDRRSKVARNR